jgi:hypothetical protein
MSKVTIFDRNSMKNHRGGISRGRLSRTEKPAVKGTLPSALNPTVLISARDVCYVFT